MYARGAWKGLRTVSGDIPNPNTNPNPNPIPTPTLTLPPPSLPPSPSPYRNPNPNQVSGDIPVAEVMAAVDAATASAPRDRSRLEEMARRARDRAA